MYIEQALYDQILQVMPIPCVDILVVDKSDRVLLLRRKNEPAAGQWWFPGGRVLFGEKREDAARRKLKEECGLVSSEVSELGTFDIIFNDKAEKTVHSITSLFKFRVDKVGDLTLDKQSSDACWLQRETVTELSLHPFVRRLILLGYWRT
jgi:ADP-ribose pyrophosphatase YjhB (NUDIX family)